MRGTDPTDAAITVYAPPHAGPSSTSVLEDTAAGSSVARTGAAEIQGKYSSDVGGMAEQFPAVVSESDASDGDTYRRWVFLGHGVVLFTAGWDGVAISGSFGCHAHRCTHRALHGCDRQEHQSRWIQRRRCSSGTDD